MTWTHVNTALPKNEELYEVTYMCISMLCRGQSYYCHHTGFANKDFPDDYAVIHWKPFDQLPQLCLCCDGTGHVFRASHVIYGEYECIKCKDCIEGYFT